MKRIIKFAKVLSGLFLGVGLILVAISINSNQKSTIVPYLGVAMLLIALLLNILDFYWLFRKK
ncbi:hypothetical protein FACS1894208_06700 [Clostridia bacterium]|nr:hypothetical protein FACS1894208_06700 [Clostridia bacterium]